MQAEPISTLPGGPATVTGGGCPPGALVRIAFAGQVLATVRADSTGHFSAALTTPNLPIGGYQLTATCGNVSLSTGFDLVLSASSSASVAGQLASEGAILVFFVFLLVTFTHTTASSKRRGAQDDGPTT
ncbi:MAG: hypothetical protein ACYDAQ_10640 [Mycobacteriales bacterium]